MEEYVSGGGELNLKQKASPGLKSETECLVSVLQVLHPDICWVKQKQHNFTAPGISKCLTIHYILKCGHCHDIGHVCRDIQHKSQVICVCVVNWEIKVGRFTRACELKLTPLDLEQLYGRPGRVLLNTSSKRHYSTRMPGHRLCLGGIQTHVHLPEPQFTQWDQIIHYSLMPKV